MKDVDDLQAEIKQARERTNRYIHEHWRLFLFEGALFILLGLAAILVPQFFSVVVVIFLGWLIVVGGIFQLVRAFYFKNMPGFWSWLVLGALQLIVGYMLIANPIAGVMTITMMMTLFFALEGVIKIYLAFSFRPLPQWQMILVSGITSLVFAIFILAFWSETVPWLLGLFMGINMIFLGYSLAKMSVLHKDSPA